MLNPKKNVAIIRAEGDHGVADRPQIRNVKTYESYWVKVRLAIASESGGTELEETDAFGPELVRTLIAEKYAASSPAWHDAKDRCLPAAVRKVTEDFGSRWSLGCGLRAVPTRVAWGAVEVTRVRYSQDDCRREAWFAGDDLLFTRDQFGPESAWGTAYGPLAMRFWWGLFALAFGVGRDRY